MLCHTDNNNLQIASFLGLFDYSCKADRTTRNSEDLCFVREMMRVALIKLCKALYVIVIAW